MSESHEDLRREFKDREYREVYAEDFLNTKIAMQMRVLREERGLTQAELAQIVGTKQAGISRLENVNHATWKIESLKKVAFGLDTWLDVSFRSYGELVDQANLFSKQWLQRPSFEDDAVFQAEYAASGIHSINITNSPSPAAVQYVVVSCKSVRSLPTELVSSKILNMMPTGLVRSKILDMMATNAIVGVPGSPDEEAA
jgi:transcriptional regulator with XRE-family HTH domain